MRWRPIVEEYLQENKEATPNRIKSMTIRELVGLKRLIDSEIKKKKLKYYHE